jgi:hypothetical protein
VDSSLGDHDDDTDADVMVNDDGDDGDGDRLGIRLGRCCLLQRGETGTFFAIVLHGTLTAAVRSSTGAVWDVVGIPGGLESERRRAGGGTGKESNSISANFAPQTTFFSSCELTLKPENEIGLCSKKFPLHFVQPVDPLMN